MPSLFKPTIAALLATLAAGPADGRPAEVCRCKEAVYPAFLGSRPRPPGISGKPRPFRRTTLAALRTERERPGLVQLDAYYLGDRRCGRCPPPAKCQPCTATLVLSDAPAGTAGARPLGVALRSDNDTRGLTRGAHYRFCLALAPGYRETLSSVQTDPRFKRVFLLGRPCAAAAATGPGVAPRSRPPTARPGAVRAADELACAKDSDCVILTPVCRGCGPCKPTWRPVGNRRAKRRIDAMRRGMGCPKVKCKRCSSHASWRGTHPVCRAGRCTFRSRASSR